MPAGPHDHGGATARGSTAVTWLALAASILVLGGSLWLSIGMNLKACPLCFYQRSFVMGIAAVLAIGLLARSRPAALLSLLALPMAVAGIAVAAFHVWLELRGTLECPRGVLGIGTAPQQSLAGLALVLVLLLIDVLRSRRSLHAAGICMTVAVVMGLALGYAAVISSPPLPAPPAEPWQSALEVCRPLYRAE